MSLTDRIAAVSARLQGLGGFPQIESERLLLRAARASDADALLDLFSDPQVMRYWSREPMRDRDEALAYVDNNRACFQRREAISWVLADLASDAVLGTCTLYDLQPRHLRSGIGYALLPACQGHGYASEAVQIACAWAYGYLGLHRIEADVHPHNEASRRLLLRCGFQSEGVLRQRFVTANEIQDSEIFGRLNDEAEA